MFPSKFVGSGVVCPYEEFGALHLPTFQLLTYNLYYFGGYPISLLIYLQRDGK